MDFYAGKMSLLNDIAQIETTPGDPGGRAGPDEAEIVQRIFALYIELGCVRRVKEEIDRLGLSTKRSTTAGGARDRFRPR
jgi:hypothetical protein